MFSSEVEISLFMFLGISALELALGALLGWFVQSNRQQAAASELAAEKDSVKQAFAMLSEMAGSLGQDVGEHATRVESIGQQLAMAQDRGGPEMAGAVLDAVAQIAEANQRLKGQLTNAEQRLQEQAGQLEHQMVVARTDALTGLANRRAFDDQLKLQLGQLFRPEEGLALLMFDIDHFKRFNDTHGHQAGDNVLKGVAQVLYRAMRDVDLVARYGGEELAVIVPGGNPQEAAEAARKAIAESLFEFEGNRLQVTVSVGVAEARLNDDPGMLIKRADTALYASKKAGRNCTHVSDGQNCYPWPPAPGLAAPIIHAAEASSIAATSISAPSSALSVPAATNRQRPAAEPAAEVGAAAAGSASFTQDLMTGLPDRHVLFTSLDQRLAECQRSGGHVSLILADIDELQALNEKHGLETGDVVLRAVTQFLTATLRQMDLIARYDGDRFALMLPATTLDQTVQTAERIRTAVSLCKLRVADADVRFTVSMGVAAYVAGDDSESLVRRAGVALNVSKQGGRNATNFHDGTTTHTAIQEPSAEAATA
jgi:diguanylate cyclase